MSFVHGNRCSQQLATFSTHFGLRQPRRSKVISTDLGSHVVRPAGRPLSQSSSGSFEGSSSAFHICPDFGSGLDSDLF